MYRYIKDYPSKSSKNNILKQLLPTGLLLLGFFLIVQAVYPIAEWTIANLGQEKNELADPGGSKILGESININEWLPQAENSSKTYSIKEYTISIPKLKIKDAQVVIGGDDLSKNLIQFGGTAEPGNKGRTVIFGHSVLPQFFNAQNYKTIFSHLPDLKNKDEIFINYDGVIYKYVVYDQQVIDPKNTTAMLSQDFSDSYLHLITCAPPGTYWKRLIIKAKIAQI